MTNITTAREGVFPRKGQRNPALALIRNNSLEACCTGRRPYVPGRCEVRPAWLIKQHNDMHAAIVAANVINAPSANTPRGPSCSHTASTQ